MQRNQTSIQHRRAFTLLEVTVVCAILAIVAGVVVLSLRGRIHATQLVQANSQIEAADRVARSVARTNGVGTALVFDNDKNEIRVVSGRRVHKVVNLPDAVSLSRFRTARGQVGSGNGLVVSPLGQSPTYAVELNYGQQARWIVVSGLSGQTFQTQKAEQVNALLRL